MPIPRPENFTVRPAIMEDVEAATDLFNACSLEQIGRVKFDVADIRREWRNPTFNLATDTLVMFAPDGKLVGYCEIWESEPYVRIFSWGRVHPEFTNRGIGAHLLQWAAGRARQAIPKAPEGARVIMLQDTLSSDAVAQELLRQQGFTAIRHFCTMVIEMDGPPPDPVAPEGLVIRPFVRETELHAVLRAMREAFKDHWGYVERPFEETLKQWSYWIDNDPDHDPSLWFIAVDGDEIAGMSLCSPKLVEDPEMAWVNTLGVRRPWRRQGLALALLHHSFCEFYRRGTRKVGLGVDAHSLTGATRLYERAGMHVDRQFTTFEKELRPGEELSTQSLDD